MSFSYPCMVWFQQWMLLWGRLLQWLRCWSLLDGRALKNREILLPQMSHSWQLTCVILHCNITHTAGFAMHTDTDIVCYKTKKFNMYFSINSHFFCTWTNIWFSVIIKGALLMKLDHCDSCVAELKQQLTLKWCLSTSKALLFFFVFPPFFPVSITVVSTVTSQKEGSQFEAWGWMWPFCKSACLWVCMLGQVVSLIWLWVWMWVFVVVCVSLLNLWWTGKLSMVYHTSHPSTAWKSPRPPYT